MKKNQSKHYLFKASRFTQFCFDKNNKTTENQILERFQISFLLQNKAFKCKTENELGCFSTLSKYLGHVAHVIRSCAHVKHVYTGHARHNPELARGLNMVRSKSPVSRQCYQNNVFLF